MKQVKKNRWGLLIVVILLAFSGAVTAVKAQSNLTPAQVVVSGTRGDIAQRTVALQTNTPLRDLQFLALDLPHADGEAVLPASAIQAALPLTELAANSFLTIPLTINLAGVPSGQYQGEAQIWHQEGVVTLPVTVKVRDGWFWPLLTLVAGVLLAMGVSYYRVKGKPRDELLVRVGVLQTAVRQDDALDDQFRARIEATLVDVEAALRAEQWERAQTAVTQAEGYWQKWRKGRADWLTQLAYATSLQEGIKALRAPQSRYLQKVAREITAVIRRAPDLEKPEKLQTALEELTEQINQYARLKAHIDGIGQMSNQLPANERPSWQQKASDWQQQLDDLAPEDETTWTSLHTAVRAAQRELTEAITAAQNREGTLESIPGVGVKGIPGQGTLAALLPLPAVAISLDDDQAIAHADRRLRLFSWIGYGLAILLLAGAGFSELYLGKATFGANGWADYLSLLAWGFGAEASRMAVTEMIKGWGLPGVT